MTGYNPSAWYWSIHSSGQIYSSAKGAVVPATDPGYIAWVESGMTATPLQDTAGLDEVLTRAGLPVSGLTPLTKAQLNAYANAKAISLLAAMRSYASGGVTLKSDATPTTLANLMALEQWGSQSANASATQPWVANDNSVTAITGAEFVSFAPMVGAYSLMIYGELAAVLGEISSGTLTSYAGVDAYAWTI